MKHQKSVWYGACMMAISMNEDDQYDKGNAKLPDDNKENRTVGRLGLTGMGK